MMDGHLGVCSLWKVQPLMDAQGGVGDGGVGEALAIWV